MNDTLKWTLIILGAALAVILLMILIFFLRRLILRRQNRYSQVKVGAVLRKFASIRSFKVISGLKLKNGDSIVEIDQVLIGFFGMILLKTCNQNGAIYGEYRDPSWVSVHTDKDKNDKKESFPNPVRAVEKCNEAMRKLLAANNLYKVETEAYVVFGDPKTQLTNAKKKRGMPLLTLKQLKKLLQREKYSADGPVDVKALYDLLMANAVH